MKLTKKQKYWAFFLVFLSLFGILVFYPLPPEAPVQFYERGSSRLKTEDVPGEKWLVWLYHNPLGEATLWAVAKRKMLSSFYGHMMDRPSSADKIDDFVKEYDIDMSAARRQEFDSFNDFFTRKLKEDARTIDSIATLAVSPADGKLLAYENIANSHFIVKGYHFDVESFLNDTVLAQNYLDGTLVIVRLAPPDYHRFHFPVSGRVSSTNLIEGYYYSVNPIALREMAEIFVLNKRTYTIISNPHFGEVVMAEVGATMVGSIVQTYSGDNVKKGQEKGYFKFGGSTVVLLFKKDQIQIDGDLLRHTEMGYETAVKMGERIGISMKNYH
ncbi:MAG: phosphatidylserine decarboxylase [Bacteroidota bacterium]|nr:phosphatidylserine decarboxylase [Bacteroidota bacterium]